MLSRLSDFYRAVYPDPSDTVISQRREALTEFLEKLAEPGLQQACIDIAAFGLSSHPNTAQTAGAQALVAAIQKQQPSFTTDILANAVDLRVFAGVALGESVRTTDDQSAVALLVSALGTRPLPTEQYVAEFVAALLNIARQSHDKTGSEQRKRRVLEVKAVAGADFPTIVKSINKALGDFREAVDGNLKADREELEILWWVFGAHSAVLDKPFERLNISERVLAAGSELAELVLLPAPTSSTQFLRAVLKDNRSLTLRQLMEGCSRSLLESVARRRGKVESVLRDHPALLPLTWLCNRRIESNMSSGWEAEFEQKTYLLCSDERAATSWAIQVFNECVAARVLVARDIEE